MEILKVTDAEFKTYGKVLEGYDCLLYTSDTWTFGKKKTAACRMIGNAFPPPVAKAVGEKIKECLENECTDCERTISLSRKIV